MPEPEQVTVAHEAHVEPLVRASRAEIARLLLQLRAVLHEAEDLEAALASEDLHERALLRTSLDELLEHRRRELEQVLEQEHIRAAAVVASARHEAARLCLQERNAVASPRRLHVVGEGDDEPTAAASQSDTATGSAPPANDALRAAEPEESPVIDEAAEEQPAAEEPDAEEPDAEVEPAQQDTTVPAAEASSARTAEPSSPAVSAAETEDPAGPAVQAADAASPQTSAGTVIADAALLRELVSAAVTAAVAEAIAATTALRPSSTAAGPWPYEPTRAQPDARLARPPLRRQLVHLDVLLPLALAVIVFVVLLAWVG